MISILIADDHSIVRHGLALLAQKALGGTCAIDFAQSGEEVLERLRQKKYKLLMSDLVMPDQKGVALIVQALEVQSDLRIIIISVGPERHFAPLCLQNGAHAYINKGASDLAFIKEIRSACYDSNDYHLRKRKKAIQESTRDKEQSSFALLSQREREVVMLLLRGQGMMEIARSLSVSPSTASTLKGRAFTKLNVQSVIELSKLAYRLGLHPDESLS